jgi:hypothetical protein
VAVLGRERTAEDVLAEVMRDQAYYRRSGGGLTLSGGEPMAQFDFALARRYPGLAGVEIMAYHAMGHHKALRVGQRAPLAGLPTAAEAQKAAWLAALHSRGCTRARLG